MCEEIRRTPSHLQLSPISRLPNETLEAIFNLHVESLHAGGKTDSRDFVAYLLVCKAWYIVALDSSRLWRYIDIGKPQIALKFLARSKVSPISIIASNEKKKTYLPSSSFLTRNLEVLEALKPHVDRIRTINIALPAESLRTIFFGIGASFPNVQSMTISVADSRMFKENSHKWNVPSLRRLELSGLGMFSCAGLTHLSLHTFQPNNLWASHLLSTLSQSPELEDLNMRFRYPLEFIPANTASIRLPRLSRYTVAASRDCTKQLLSIISTPPFTSMHLEPVRTVLRLSRMSLRLTGDKPVPWSPKDTSLKLTIPVDFDQQFGQYYFHISLLSPCVSAFDMMVLTVLELDVQILQCSSRDDIQRILTATPLLSTLRIARNPLRDVLSLLCDAESNNLVCPVLEVLSFGKTHSPWYGLRNALPRIVRGLRHRKRHFGMNLETVEFIWCPGLDLKMTKRLHSSVQRVVIQDYSFAGIPQPPR